MAKNYFVTGATGVIGSALLPLLLEDQNSRIWVLIRADSSEHMKKRFEELITFWGMDDSQARDARLRIIPLLGDVDEVRFALADEIYADIAGRCTHIIHCAGVVRMTLPLEAARRHAPGSAKNIVELALACRPSGLLQKIDYVSTVGVAGRMRGVLPETWITEVKEFHTTYEQAKAEAEDYLREQMEQYGLPVTLHRPSMVVADSKTGKVIRFQVFYFFCEFISGCRTFGILPYFNDWILDTVPVDYVTQVIKWSSEQGESSVGKILHTCSGPERSMRLTEVQKMVRILMKNYGIKLPLIFHIPLAVYTPLLKLFKPLLPKKMWRRLLPIFADYLQDKHLFDNKNTLAYLQENAGPELPLANDYLEKVLSVYLNTLSTKQIIESSTAGEVVD